jgi:serine/threonine protein kinase
MINRNVIGGKYRLKHKIGEGAMGVVWAALNQQTSREVAVKLISSADEQLRQRLIREACTCGQLSHRNIIEVLDAGVTEDRDPYLVMPLLVGETLADLLNRKRRLDAPVVAQIARDIAKALTAAHAANIVHRDLKPANIFLHKEAGSDGTVVKVMDFGICKRLESKDEKLTATGKVIGSPSYMSPEQFVPEKGIDHRTDIWSLGVIMFEMLTGERPFQGDRMKVILNIIDSDVEIPRVSRLVRFVPQALVDIVAGCLVRERDQRIDRAAELVEMLQAIASPGDAVGIYSEASRRTSTPSSAEPPSRDAFRAQAPPEEAAAAAPVFPRSLDDSSIITLPREPGPRRAAARRRPAVTPVAQPAEGAPVEANESQSEADESARVDIRSAHQAKTVSEDDVDDAAATTPLSVRRFAPAARAPEAPPPSTYPDPPPQFAHPATATAAREEAQYNEPLAVHAPHGYATPRPTPAPSWRTTVPLNSRELNNGCAPPAVRKSADSIGAFTGTMWAPRRTRPATLRKIVIGAMVSIASILFATSFVAATSNSPAPAPALAETSISELAPELRSARATFESVSEPAENEALPASPPPPPPEAKKRVVTPKKSTSGLRPTPPQPPSKSAPVPRTAKPTLKTPKTTSNAPCSKKLIKKC